MSSREKILEAVKINQPMSVPLPDISMFNYHSGGSLEQFASVLMGIGGNIVYVSNHDEIRRLVLDQYGNQARIITTVVELDTLNREKISDVTSIHDLQDVEVAILNARFGVAENGAVWITEADMYFRVLPFITQHLAVVLHADDIVPTMHAAYDHINNADYDFGSFIAGPSKTADIEQSLVIGAHGPRSMTVFVMLTAKE